MSKRINKCNIIKHFLGIKMKRSDTKEILIDHLISMLGNPDHAIEAIKSRNLKIKSLQAEIQHRKIAEKEIMQRMDELNSKNEKLEFVKADMSATIQSLIEKNTILEEEKKKLKKYLSEFENKFLVLEAEVKTKELLKTESWSYKVKELCDTLPKWSILGPVFSFLLTPPTSKYVLLILFVAFFIASIVGWPTFVENVQPIFNLFRGS